MPPDATRKLWNSFRQRTAPASPWLNPLLRTRASSTTSATRVEAISAACPSRPCCTCFNSKPKRVSFQAQLQQACTVILQMHCPAEVSAPLGRQVQDPDKPLQRDKNASV